MDLMAMILICQTVIYVATLIVLTWQIYELRKSIRSGSFLTVGQSYIPSMLEVVKKPELGKCFKIYEKLDLSDKELSEKFFMHILICNFINAHNNWKLGLYSDESWKAWKKWFKKWIAGEKFLKEWNTTKDIFSKDFVEFVDKLLSDKK